MAKKPHIPFVEFPMESLNFMELFPLVTRANLELGRYDGTLNSILNPHVLLSPITNREAILSSKIEGTIASLTEVLEYDASEKADDNRVNDIKEIVNYRQALFHAKDSIQDRDISMSLIRELHQILTEDVRGGDKTPGQIRTSQNWIGSIGSAEIEKARFIPPSPESLPVALDNLENFINDDFVDSLLQLAIVHAQFEILHPFNDGNGRLGRMLIPLFLFKKEVIQSPAFYLSEFFEENDSEYRDRLLAITENDDWQGWCDFFLRALIAQSVKNNTRALSIINLYEKMKEEFVNVTQSRHAQSALDALFKRPIINSTTFISDAGIDSRETGNNILRKLKDNGLISIAKEGAGSRPPVYIMQGLIDIADGKGGSD